MYTVIAQNALALTDGKYAKRRTGMLIGAETPKCPDSCLIQGSGMLNPF